MASFLRARQAGIQNDLSAGIAPGSFSPGEPQSRHGINSQISCIAYDPVQSLLAVGTHESRYGPGKIYVFGQRRVARSLELAPSSSPPHLPPSSFSSSFPSPLSASSFPLQSQKSKSISVRALRFVAPNRLLSLDARNELCLWDLAGAAGRPVARHVYYGRVICLVTDPGIDWAFVGLEQGSSAVGGGEVVAYDLDRERVAAGWKLENFWRAREKEAGRAPGGGYMGMGMGRGAPSESTLVGMQLHPRDIGKLLIAYAGGAVVYSFKENRVTKWFEYVVPAGAPGGDGRGVDTVRKPRVVQAVWHPTGTFVLTAHEDGSLVFWDAKDGRLVAARSVYETRVNEPGKGAKGMTAKQLVPFGRISWCCKRDPDDTALLIAGGQAVDDQQKGLTFLELGPTPTYATSSWEVLANHFEGKQRLTLAIPPGAEISDYCLVPRSSPFFDGAQDPIAVLVLLTSGEIVTMSFPSGYPITPTNMLHPSLSFVHPFVQKIAISTIQRERWLSLVETRNHGTPILQGGAPSERKKYGIDARNIISVAHTDSTIRVWDVGHDDEIENPGQLQVDVARSLDRFEDVSVTALALADVTAELAVGTKTGEVVVYKWGINPYYGRDATKPIDPNPGGLTDISSRAEPSLKEGLQPFVLFEMMKGPVSVVSVSNVGFVAAGSEGGFLSIIDLRGPKVIFHAAVSDFVKAEKRSSFLKASSKSKGGADQPEFPTAIEFGVMTLEGDSYSSIACFVGTNLGHVATFKLLPAGQSYSTQLAGYTKVGGDRVMSISPVNADTGQPAAATGITVAGLRDGRQVNGVIVAVTQTEIRVFKPATAKGASKTFDDHHLCDVARVVEFPGAQQPCTAVVALFGDRTARAYSLPALKEIGRASLPLLDQSRTLAAVISRGGDIIGWTGPSEIAVLPVSGNGNNQAQQQQQQQQQLQQDTLINPQLTLPPRPTISNLQWISGTQYVSPTDLDLLIGGEDRPPSKRMVAAAAAERRGAAAAAAASSQGGSRGHAQHQQEGWGEYLARQVGERAERLTAVDDAMSRLQETTAGWAEDVNRFVRKQKRDALLGGLKKSLF